MAVGAHEHNRVCPRCKGPIPAEGHEGEYPGAISRWDNETEICSDCGQREAIYQLTHGGGYRKGYEGGVGTLPPPDVDLRFRDA